MSDQPSGGFNFNDLLGGGKGLEVLANLIQATFGRVFQSHFIKKDADAKAYELRTLAAAQADGKRLLAAGEADSIKLITDAIKEAAPGTGGIVISEGNPVIKSLPASEHDRLSSTLTLQERSEINSHYRDAVKQQNIESVTANAAEQLRNETDISDEKVDRDWTARFFKHVEDISSEDMQMIWGKILAGEIKQPKTYTYRTMEVLKNLTQFEAELFGRYANRTIWQRNDFAFLVNLNDSYKIPLGYVARLEEAGLLAQGENVNYFIDNDDNEKVLISFDWVIHVQAAAEQTGFRIPVYLLTTAGEQICKLIKPDSDLAYLSEFATKIKDTKRIVKLGKILNHNPDGSIHYEVQPGW